MSVFTRPTKQTSAHFQKDSPVVIGIRNFLLPNNSKLVWRERFDKFAKPRVLISAFLATSALYCFVIGRDRYTSVSEFVIQQAAPLDGASASIVSGTAASPQVLTSLVDGQYLQVYLESADVKKRLFPIQKSSRKIIKSSFRIYVQVCLSIVLLPSSSTFIDINYRWLHSL